MRLFLSLSVATLFLFGAWAADAHAGDYGQRGYSNHGSSYSGSFHHRGGNSTYYRNQTRRYSNQYRALPVYRNHYVAPVRSSYVPSYRRSCGGY